MACIPLGKSVTYASKGKTISIEDLPIVMFVMVVHIL